MSIHTIVFKGLELICSVNDLTCVDLFLNPFFSLDNVLLTPHNAALTLECRERMSLEASQNILYFLKNMSALNEDNLVNKKFI